jgi:chemotaxis protein methyltransferase CheR
MNQTAVAAGSASSSTRDFEFTDEDFERVRRMIHVHAGISLSPMKRDMVYSRLARRLRAKGLKDFQAYLNELDSGSSDEWEEFTNALTTNLTSFFREPHHFPVLSGLLSGLPRGKPISLWCCAASTGEEPYTIAMTAVEAFGGFDAPVRILATDVDTNVLARAEAGIYDNERIEKLSAERLRRFFLRGNGAHSGQVRVRPELRELVTFRQLNLLHEDWPIRGPFDAIFCRNVMIYFDKPTQLVILERFAPLLAGHGLLFVGHSESLHHAAQYFKLQGKTVYQHARGGATARKSR